MINKIKYKGVPAMQIFADNLSRVTISNNNIRVELTQNGSG